MKKEIYIFAFMLFCLPFLFATKVLFIPNEPFAIEGDNDTISFHLMKNIMERLGIVFEYEYVARLDAMQRIDDEENIIIFPYIRPRNMSNRILLSDTLYVSTHKVFYNTRIYDYLEIGSLGDLRTYIIGSHAGYPFEPDMRRAGLTVFYSHNNLESMQRLINQDVGFVIEEKIKGLKYLSDIEVEGRTNIGFYDLDLFPIPLFIAAPIRNEEAALVISQINHLIEEREFIDQLIKEFFEGK
ncbi:MAG: hypothetical protein FWG98_09230 [Candidatus Cloacimonetes bacterium]|nr:hypothetical protein [Candidatus Cloacimonadota bacterium]